MIKLVVQLTFGVVALLSAFLFPWPYGAGICVVLVLAGWIISHFLYKTFRKADETSAELHRRLNEMDNGSK
ncbi:hypothetical protein SAMN06265374_2777 [Roseibium denhamense]|uniref:Uncharacterized protein n=2 Tax=Roseibium denhamense TaxID=76305 RepID=A0ABY1P5A6_9HYPH|nr:hypothetical protein SAMN06265374_2777 [Roseibium denhamense]